jgi:hypothetical protein
MTFDRQGAHDDKLMTTLQSLIDEEEQLTAQAGARLGSVVHVAETALALLNTFVVSISEQHFMAAALQLAIQKTATLAYLSYIRKHHAQAEFNTRQLIEYCALCAYLLAHPLEDVMTNPSDKSGAIRPSKAMSIRAYKWLHQSLRTHSQILKEAKEQINDTAAHASIFLTQFTFDWEASVGDEYRGSFFDNMEPDAQRLYLMSFARVVLVVTDTLRRTAMKHGGFEIREGLEGQLRQLELRLDAHRAAIGKRMGLFNPS